MTAPGMRHGPGPATTLAPLKILGSRAWRSRRASGPSATAATSRGGMRRPAEPAARAASTTQAACGTLSPGASPLRRLTQSEYDNTVRDLLGDTSNPASAFPPDQRQGDFSNTAVALTVSPLLAQSYEIGRRDARDHGGGAPLDDRRRATRRRREKTPARRSSSPRSGSARSGAPSRRTNRAGSMALYETNRSAADYNNGIQSVIEAILQSAPFLYRPEFGSTSLAQGTVVPLTSYEMASRLSYFLWGSMPDDALFAAADANALTTADAGRRPGDAPARRPEGAPGRQPVLQRVDGRRRDRQRPEGPDRLPDLHPGRARRHAAGDPRVRRLGHVAVGREARDAPDRARVVREPVSGDDLRRRRHHGRHAAAGGARLRPSAPGSSRRRAS